MTWLVRLAGLSREGEDGTALMLRATPLGMTAVGVSAVPEAEAVRYRPR